MNHALEEDNRPAVRLDAGGPLDGEVARRRSLPHVPRTGVCVAPEPHASAPEPDEAAFLPAGSANAPGADAEPHGRSAGVGITAAPGPEHDRAKMCSSPHAARRDRGYR